MGTDASAARRVRASAGADGVGDPGGGGGAVLLPLRADRVPGASDRGGDWLRRRAGRERQARCGAQGQPALHPSDAASPGALAAWRGRVAAGVTDDAVRSVSAMSGQERGCVLEPRARRVEIEGQGQAAGCGGDGVRAGRTKANSSSRSSVGMRAHARGGASVAGSMDEEAAAAFGAEPGWRPPGLADSVRSSPSRRENGGPAVPGDDRAGASGNENRAGRFAIERGYGRTGISGGQFEALDLRHD